MHFQLKKGNNKIDISNFGENSILLTSIDATPTHRITMLKSQRSLCDYQSEDHNRNITPQLQKGGNWHRSKWYNIITKTALPYPRNPHFKTDWSSTVEELLNLLSCFSEVKSATSSSSLKSNTPRCLRGDRFIVPDTSRV